MWTRSHIRSCLFFTFQEIFSGNNGQTPIDSIDQCCEHHDNCYDNVMNTGNCDLPHPMLVSYNWSLVNSDYSDDGVTLVCDDCATSPGLESVWSILNFIINLHDFRSSRGSDYDEDKEQRKASCACQSCMCDIQIADCLHKVNKCPSPLFGVLDRKLKW